ncbi:MAG: hypothetical protein MZV70_60070 [Desulfobacterales bacterium]|nr:hypothetical protein [Desulfobacterales bacterium]
MARASRGGPKKSASRKGGFIRCAFKIPLQVMATLVVAVLAVYIYRSGDERVKDILPGSRQPVMEM